MHRPQHLQINMKPDFLIGLSLALLLIPIKWIFAWLIAVFTHEVFHFLAMRCMGVPVYSATLSLKGVEMHTLLPGPRATFICALAGPLGGFMLILLARWMPRTAICGFLHALYNLVPIVPFDGGRALQAFVSRFFPNGRSFYRKIENIAIALVIAACTYAFLRLSLGIYALLFALLFLIKTGRIKIPCKPAIQRVQ